MATTLVDGSITADQLGLFLRDGYLVVRGLFDETELQSVTEGCEELSSDRPGLYFGTILKGAMFDNKAFWSMAVHSKMPKIAAELMQLNEKNQSVRILRDVYLAKEVAKDDTCGWHVDDQGFWPESYLSSASENSGKDQYGINAWVALDDMPKPFEGSMEVARGSHKAPWRWEAYQAIGQDRTRPGLSKEELFESLRTGKFKQFGTCEGIKSNRADLGETLRESSEIFDLQKGDVIFATRMLFHRTRKVTPEGIEFYKKSGKQVLNRYSVRYVPGTARLLEGFTTEWSILDHPDNAGRSLDEVANDKENEDWYPKVWPVVDEPSVISKTKIDQTRGKEKELMAELMQVMK